MLLNKGAMAMYCAAVGLSLVLLAGCGKEPAAAPDARNRDDEVRTALFERWLSQYQESLKRPHPEFVEPCYLQITAEGKEADPPDAMVGALKKRGVAIRKGSECIPQTEGVFDKATGKKGGILLKVGPIKWTGPSAAEVEFTTYQGGTGGSWQMFKCRRTDGHWELTPGPMEVS